MKPLQRADKKNSTKPFDVNWLRRLETMQNMGRDGATKVKAILYVNEHSLFYRLSDSLSFGGTSPVVAGVRMLKAEIRRV